MGNSYCAYTKVNFQETAEQKSAQSAFIRAIRVQGFDCKITPRNTHHATRLRFRTNHHLTLHCTTRTSVPTSAHPNSHAASSVRRLTQPWLMGVPKLLCQ